MLVRVEKIYEVHQRDGLRWYDAHIVSIGILRFCLSSLYYWWDRFMIYTTELDSCDIYVISFIRLGLDIEVIFRLYCSICCTSLISECRWVNRLTCNTSLYKTFKSLLTLHHTAFFNRYGRHKVLKLWFWRKLPCFHLS